MEPHPFDKANRVTAGEAAALGVTAWQPPTIDHSGHLVYAEPRSAARNERAEPAASAAPAVEPTEADRKRGYDEGFAKGKQEGMVAGQQEGAAAAEKAAQAQMQQNLKPKLGELNRLLTTLGNAINEQDYQLEQTLMRLVVEISEAVIRKELALDKAHIMNLIREAIASLPPNRDNIAIRLHPTDKEWAEQAVSEGGEHWRVLADESMEPGGCRVETDQSLLDFSLPTRLQDTLDQLYEAKAVAPKPGDPDYQEAPEPAVTASPAAEQAPDGSESSADSDHASESAPAQQLEGNS